MIESYFAIWLTTAKKKAKDEPLASSVRETWKYLNAKEKVVFVVFLLSSAVMMCLSVVATLNNYALFPVFILSLLVFLGFAVLANITTTLFRRRMPERWLAKDAAFARSLRASFKSAGIVSCEQLKTVRDEALRIL